MMFAQFFTIGCVNPVISLYLQHHLHFDALATGIILSGSTLAAFTTPLVAAFIADRLVSSRILLAACNLLAAGANLILAGSTDFAGFFAAWMVLAVVQGPVPGLVTTLAFHHLDDGVRQFGPVRLWGTIGWVAAGWLLSLAWMLVPLCFPGLAPGASQPLIFWLATAGSLATAAMGLLLPGSQGQARAVRPEGADLWQTLLPREALQALRSPLFVVLALLYFGGGLMDRLFYFGAAPYLPLAGFPEGSVVAVLTLGQLVEVLMLAFLGKLITRLGFGRGILLGLVLQTLRPLLLAIPGPVSALTGIALHGVIVGFIHMGIIMQVNQHCDFASRSGVNQIYNFLFAGLASLAGNLGGGLVLRLAQADPAGTSGPGQAGWTVYWLASAACGLVFVAVFLLWYPRRPAAVPAGSGPMAP